MPLTSDLNLSASKFSPEAISKETHAFNDQLIKIMEGGPKWYEAGAANYRLMRENGETPLNPGLRAYLPEALRKLGRYYEVAQNLTGAARSTKNLLFQKIIVLPVERNSIGVEALMSSLASFDDAMSRMANSSINGLQFSREDRNLARMRYENRLLYCETKWKVDAEVQLLLFYELNPTIRPPRVICTSKSACYLCNLFFQIHGRFQIPRTHGRIYDKWILPFWPPEQLHIIENWPQLSSDSTRH